MTMAPSLKRMSASFLPLLVDDVLLLVEFRVEQVAILMVADALVVLGRIECLA
jgi:hypothetical protein